MTLYISPGYSERHSDKRQHNTERSTLAHRQSANSGKSNAKEPTHMGKPLIVYKASAGSGKTFTLATEYIKLLVENPQNYRGILAVTFTNKATEEMKRRILSQLYGIWRRLDDSESYTQNVCQQLDATPEFVSI